MVDELKNKIKRILPLLLCLLSTQGGQAQLLWEISKEGEPTSYILGTHHVIPSDIVEGIAGVEQAYTQSNVLIGELDIREMSTFSTNPENSLIMMAPSDSTLNQVLSRKHYKLLTDFFESPTSSTQLPTQLINNFKPQTISTFISVDLATRANKKLFPNNNSPLGVDMIFEERALKEGKEIIGLESLTFQTKLLYGSKSIAQAAKELENMLDCISQNEEAVLRSSQELALLYQDEKLEEILKLATTPDELCPALTMSKADWKQMVDDRNRAWIPKLASAMQQNKCFIIVGALHLPGESGVLNLLRNEGYTVSPKSK